MSLVIDTDPHGRARIPFPELRDQLVLKGLSFTTSELDKLPYQQLRLAAIANAGIAACSIEDVVTAKERRRERFLAMSPEDMNGANRYLRAEGMYGDIQCILGSRIGARWVECSTRAQLWLKLNCLHDHTDVPNVRLREILDLTARALSAKTIDAAMAQRFQWDVDHISMFYPHAMSGDQLREKAGCMAEELLTLLTEEEWTICHTGVVVDYSCSSDCYRTI